MAVYQYIAKDGAGRKFSGIYTDIEDVTDLRQELSKISCVLLKARQKKEIVVKHKSIKKSEIVTFAYKLSGMYSAGLPILNCLETLESQADNPALKYILGDITKSIKDGANLKEACAKHRQIFSDFFIAMVEAGESSGKLGTTLEMSAEYMEKQEDVRRKVISAFTYPVAVSITCFAVIVFLLAFVMPTFVKLYQQAHVELPLPTRILIGLSDGVINYWWAIIILVIGGVIIVRKMLKEQHLRLKWDTFKLNVPGISRLSRLLVVSHFTRTF
jgi:type IV pilus assembly protein PilC